MESPSPLTPACETPPAWLARLGQGPAPAVLLFVYLAGMLFQVHFGSSGPVERDGYFHARVAQMFFERGLSRQFPWTQVSTWRETYCDKDFLYHALMAPFARSAAEPFEGALVFSMLLVLAIFGLLYAMLRAQRVPMALLFTAALGCMGYDFLLRLTMVRSHVLSIALALLAVQWLLTGRWKALGLLGFAYAWSYSFPYVLVLIGLPYAVGRWAGGGRSDWRGPLACALGVTLGLVLHPFSPLTLETFATLVQIMWRASGDYSTFRLLGDEFFPNETRAALLGSPLLFATWFGLCLAGWRLGRRASPETLGVLFVACLWMVMMLLFKRFVEYAVPFTAVALALVARDALAAPGALAWAKERRQGLVLVFALVLSLAHGLAISRLYEVSGSADPPRFRGAAEWMGKNLQPGEPVVNLAWSDFPDLFYDGHRQRFAWGIDPTFTTRNSTAQARMLARLFTGQEVADPVKVGQVFQARYMTMARAQKVLEVEPWRVVYQDRFALIYSLAPDRGAEPMLNEAPVR